MEPRPETPDLGRGDGAKETADARRFTDRNLHRYPQTKEERYREEFEGDRYA